MAQPNQPSVAQERFGRSSGRLTASQVIETCATILAGVILLGLAWTNPQPYAPVDLIAGLSGAAALIVGVRLPQVRPMLRSWPAIDEDDCRAYWRSAVNRAGDLRQITNVRR